MSCRASTLLGSLDGEAKHAPLNGTILTCSYRKLRCVSHPLDRFSNSGYPAKSVIPTSVGQVFGHLSTRSFHRRPCWDWHPCRSGVQQYLGFENRPGVVVYTVHNSSLDSMHPCNGHGVLVASCRLCVTTPADFAISCYSCSSCMLLLLLLRNVCSGECGNAMPILLVTSRLGTDSPRMDNAQRSSQDSRATWCLRLSHSPHDTTQLSSWNHVV